MSTIHQLREGLNEAWDTLIDGWQRLYRRAAGAITRFSPGVKDLLREDTGKGQDIALRSAGWGVLVAEVRSSNKNCTLNASHQGETQGQSGPAFVHEYRLT
jgi:HSP20 family protein